MKRFFQVLLVISLLLLVLSTPTALANEGWTITAFDSLITIQASGITEVEENISVDFGVLQKHGIYRDLPIVYQDNQGDKAYTTVVLKSVLRDGRKESFETLGGSPNLRIKIGDQDKTIAGVHRYTIIYTAKGILRSYTDYDELYWNVTGNDWDVPIEKTSAKVSLLTSGLKQAVCFQGNFGGKEPCQISKTGDREADYLGTRPLDPNEGLTIVFDYTKGLIPILTVPKPRTFEDIFFEPVATFSFLVSILGIFLVIFWRWFTKGRDQSTSSQSVFTYKTIVAEYESPDHLRPAELGTLVDEHADTLDVTATLIDLATRGYLTIKEEPKKWLFGSTDYLLIRIKKTSADLLVYEKNLLTAIFKSGDEVQMSNLTNTFYTDLAAVKKALYQEVVDKKLFLGNPDTIRTNYLVTGVVIIVVGVGLIYLSAQTLIGLLLGIGSGLFVGGFIVALFARVMPAKTAYGREMYRKAQGYKLFIETAERYRQQFFEKENLFNEVLPYAITFGLTKKFAKAMEKMGYRPPQPTWYYGSHPFNSVVFASDINNLSHSLSTAIAASPSSSGGSGGFSGGGFGGGGGGSW